MATVIGDRDVLLLGSSQRALNPPNSGILLTTSAPAFKVDTGGNPLPSSITIKASLIGISGFVNFTATGATVTDHGDNTATLAFSSLTGASCTVAANITVNGQAFTSSTTLAKVTDGSSGTSGTSGNQYATAYLYQWAASQPALPNGTTGFTWTSGINSTYSGTDNWSLSASNPSSPGLKLYVASVQITAAAGTASTTVSYSTATIQVWSANGTNGTNGVSGVQSTTVQVYRWDSSTAPAAPAGSPTYIWSGANAGTFGAAPSGWVLSPGTAPSQGMTLWAARVRVTDSATNSSTVFNWSDSAIIAVGSSGSNGAAGASGASYVTAYCASSTGTTSTAPAQTTGKTSLPATNDGGITGTWSATVPALSTNQYLYQSDGIYDPQTNKVTWSIPYWSSLKVGNLSAITVNTGRLYISDTVSDTAGNWSIDSNGHMTAESWTLKDGATVVMQAGGQLNAAYAAAGTLNSQQQWNDVSGTGKPSDYATVSGADAATSLGFNPQFSNWTGTWPAGWNSWGSAPARETATVRTAPYAVKWTATGGATGMEALVGFAVPLPAGSFVQGAFDINIITNNGGGSPGYLIRLFTNAAQTVYTDTLVPVPDKTVTGWQHVPFTARVPLGQQVWGIEIFQMASWSGMPGGDWAAGSVCIFDNLTFDFYDSSIDNRQQQWVDVGGSGKPQDNATAGAPPGTNVGSTPATTVESNAAAGKSASDAIPGINSAIADKLSKTSASSLAATITLATGGSILSGTTTNGTYQSPSGFYGVQGGVVKFSVPISGDPTFGGQLTAAYGSFGSVTIASGGYVASGQTAYNTGNGFFLGYSGSTPVFSLGNANGTGIRWDGSSLTIQNANVSSSFAATVTNTVNSTYWPVPKATTDSFAGSYTANPTGGSGNYTYAWTVSSSGREQGWIGQSNTQQVSLSVSGTNVTRSIDYYLQCIVTDTTSKISITVGITTTVDFQ